MKCVYGIILNTFFVLGTSFHSEKLTKLKDIIPNDEPIVFVVGAMAHGSVRFLCYTIYPPKKHVTVALFSFQQIYNEYSAPLIKIQNWILRLWMFYTITIAQLNERTFFTITCTCRKEWLCFSWFSDRPLLPWTHSTLSFSKRKYHFQVLCKAQIRRLVSFMISKFLILLCKLIQSCFPGSDWCTLRGGNSGDQSIPVIRSSNLCQNLHGIWGGMGSVIKLPRWPSCALNSSRKFPENIPRTDFNIISNWQWRSRRSTSLAYFSGLSQLISVVYFD